MEDFKNLPMVADVSMNTEKLKSLRIKIKSVEESMTEVVKNYKIT